MMRKVILLLLLCLATAGCRTLDVSIEHQPTPDSGAVSTLSALILEGTRTAALATQMSLPVTPTPVTGRASGQVCYPSGRIPRMTLYFWNTETNAVEQASIQANQARYQEELPPGTYIAFAWVREFQVGGLYSEAVKCGMMSTCTDHTPAEFTITAGQTEPGVDICDWAFAAEDLPEPPDFNLPVD